MIYNGFRFPNLSVVSLNCFLRKCLFSILSVGPIPTHIALIMDGNRRFAKKRNLLEGDGHRAGYDSFISMLRYCYELGVKYITVYAFSIENFKRKPQEVEFLMNLMVEKIQELIKYGMRLYFIGNLNLLSEGVRIEAEKAMKATAHNTQSVLLICVAYTSRDEMVHAVEESYMEKVDKTVCSEEEEEGVMINLGDVERNMYMSVAPDPDMVIRSSGETRLSNFLLWQTSYSPLYSPSALWPEMRLWHLVWVVLDFQRNYNYLQKKKKQT